MPHGSENGFHDCAKALHRFKAQENKVGFSSEYKDLQRVACVRFRFRYRRQCAKTFSLAKSPEFGLLMEHSSTVNVAIPL